MSRASSAKTIKNVRIKRNRPVSNYKPLATKYKEIMQQTNMFPGRGAPVLQRPHSALPYGPGAVGGPSSTEQQEPPGELLRIDPQIDVEPEHPLFLKRKKRKPKKLRIKKSQQEKIYTNESVTRPLSSTSSRKSLRTVRSLRMLGVGGACPPVAPGSTTQRTLLDSLLIPVRKAKQDSVLMKTQANQ